MKPYSFFHRIYNLMIFFFPILLLDFPFSFLMLFLYIKCWSKILSIIAVNFVTFFLLCCTPNGNQDNGHSWYIVSRKYILLKSFCYCTVSFLCLYIFFSVFFFYYYRRHYRKLVRYKSFKIELQYKKIFFSVTIENYYWDCIGAW